MNLVLLQIMKENTFLSPPPQLLQSLNSSSDDDDDLGFNLNTKVSPTVLLIIIILAIIFFVSGLLHLLVRFLLRPPDREPEDLESVTALQGQLQQLFHLHDAGVDQSYIDTLPVFNYNAIIGLKKNPFDCAVCLCEFEGEDMLRLLPKCSHAFHMECIDTWLLSHSTCPLCRASLLSDFSANNNVCSPIVLVLESGSESSREIGSARDGSILNHVGRTSSVLRTNSHLGFHFDNDLGSSRIEKSCEILVKEETLPPSVVDTGDKVVPVKLGKFRNVDVGEGSSYNDDNADARRCFSMGSFEYVMDENSLLRVPIRTPMKKQSIKKPPLPLTPGHQPAMSECDCESRREFSGFDIEIKSVFPGIDTNAGILSARDGNAKKDSFSISKIWLQGKNENQLDSNEDPSRRAFSFRFPMNKVSISNDESKAKKALNVGTRRTQSELGISRLGDRGNVSNCNPEHNQSSSNSLTSQAKTPCFARKTLLWLVGRQNKVVHSSPTPNNV